MLNPYYLTVNHRILEEELQRNFMNKYMYKHFQRKLIITARYSTPFNLNSFAPKLFQSHQSHSTASESKKMVMVKFPNPVSVEHYNYCEICKNGELCIFSTRITNHCEQLEKKSNNTSKVCHTLKLVHEFVCCEIVCFSHAPSKF